MGKCCRSPSPSKLVKLLKILFKFKLACCLLAAANLAVTFGWKKEGNMPFILCVCIIDVVPRFTLVILTIKMMFCKLNSRLTSMGKNSDTKSQGCFQVVPDHYHISLSEFRPIAANWNKEKYILVFKISENHANLLAYAVFVAFVHNWSFWVT